MLLTHFFQNVFKTHKVWKQITSQTHVNYHCKPHLTLLLFTIFPSQALQSFYHILKVGQVLVYLPAPLPAIFAAKNSIHPSTPKITCVSSRDCYLLGKALIRFCIHKELPFPLCSHSSWAKICSQVCLLIRQRNAQEKVDNCFHIVLLRLIGSISL